MAGIRLRPRISFTAGTLPSACWKPAIMRAPSAAARLSSFSLSAFPAPRALTRLHQWIAAEGGAVGAPEREYLRGLSPRARQAPTGFHVRCRDPWRASSRLGTRAPVPPGELFAGGAQAALNLPSSVEQPAAFVADFSQVGEVACIGMNTIAFAGDGFNQHRRRHPY